MTTSIPPQNCALAIDKARMIAAFNQAAPQYEAAARLQKEIAQRLLERLHNANVQPHIVVDLGCGVGTLTRELARLYRKAHLYALDIAPAMLAQARQQAPRWFSRQHFCCADAARLPLATASVDLLVSNLMLQWCTDYAQVFKECARVLKPDGMLLFSSFGPDTLKELRDSWAVVDNAPHVNAFVDLHALGDAMQQAGLRQSVMDVDWLTMTFVDLPSALRHLKKIGAHNVLSQRSRGLLGKQKYQHLLRALAAYQHADGRIPATYEVTYGYALGTAFPQQQHSDGSVHIPLATLRR